MRKHLVCITALLGAALIPAHTAGAATATDAKAAAAKGAAWIRAQQQSTGSLGGFGGDWSLSALAAAGISPSDVRTATANPSAQDYYANNWAVNGPGGAASDAARDALAGAAAGIQVSRVSATTNLVSRIASFFDGAQIGDPTLVNDDIFATLALDRAGAPKRLVGSRADWIAAHRTADGGFNWSASATTADADTTGAAIAALCAGGRSASDPVVAGALSYLHTRQNAASGGFGTPSFGPNTDTTAWIVAGLNACGIDPNGAAWTTTQGKTPDDFLIAQQNSDGSLQWKPGDRQHSLYATQDAVRSLAGAAFSAAPVVSSGGQLLRAAPLVAAGTSVPLTLVVDDGTADVHLCEVHAPVGAALSTLLDDAVAGDTPAGCVTSWSRSSDGQRVGAVNATAEAPGFGSWHIQRNGATAALDDPLGLGDMVVLTYGP